MKADHVQPLRALFAVVSLILAGPACEKSPLDAPGDLTGSLTPAVQGQVLDHRTLCDPSGHVFTLDIDNEFFPLPVGRRWLLQGEEEGTAIRVQMTVLDETEIVAGVTTRVLEEAEWEDGELVEVSRNFFAQTEEGTVCYFGEEEDPPAPGDWRADNPQSRPGIIMPANPEVGMVYQQEHAPTARDRGGIVGEGEEVTVPYGTFDQTLLIQDCNAIEDPGCNPLEDGDLKVYVSDLGIIADSEAELTKFQE
jgi:hypothetical protein